MMKTPLVLVCLALVTLAVKASAEGNTGAEDEALSQTDNSLPADPGGNPGGSIDIDESGTNDEESRGRGQEVKEPAENGEKNGYDYNDERNYGTKDDDNPYEYNYENDGKDSMKKLTDLKPDSAEEDTDPVKLSAEQGGSPLPPGTGIQDSAAEHIDAQETEGKNPSSAGNLQSQIEGAAVNGLPHLPDLPSLLSPKSRAGPSGTDVNSQSLGPDSGNQTSMLQSPDAADAVPKLPQLPPLSLFDSTGNQGGMANPNPETGSSNTDAQSPFSSSQNSGAPYAIPKLPDLPLLSDNQATFPNSNTDLNKTAGSVPHQGSANFAFSLPKLPDLPALSPVESQIEQAPSTSSPAHSLGLGESSNLQPRLPGLSGHESGTKQSQTSNLDNQLNSASTIKGQNPASDTGSSSIKAAGDEGLPPLPKLPNLPSLQLSNLPNLPTANPLVEQANLNSKILSTEKDKPSGPFMTGTQVDRANFLPVDEVNKNQRLPALQTPNLGSLMGPGPVFLPTARRQEFQPSSTVAFNRNVNDQTRLETIQVPFERFGDGNTASTGLASNINPTRMTLGNEGLLSQDDPDRGNYSPMEGEEEEENDHDNFYPDNKEKDHIDLDDQTEQEQDEDTGVPDGNNDNSYEPDYYGEDNEEEEEEEVDGGEEEYQLQGVEDPGHNVLEEPNPQERPETSDNVRTGVADETTVKTKAPNKPTNMVLFYTWLILIVLTAVVTISTCKSRIVGVFNRSKKGPGHQRPPEEGKRLLEHEYV